jgi:hypothetical protein
MRCALARPVLVFCIAAASSWSTAMVATSDHKDAAMQLKLLQEREPAKAQVTRLETPQAKNRPQATPMMDNASVMQESGQTKYGAVIAAFVLMGAIAIRRHRSGRP